MSDNKFNLRIGFGAFSEPLRDQLEGFDIPTKVISGFQQQADAITRLHIGSILADGEAKKARGRLFRNIEALAIAKFKARKEPTP